MELEPSGTAVKLSITHTIDRDPSKLIVAVSGGWPKVISNLKSLLETGSVAIQEPYPAASANARQSRGARREGIFRRRALSTGPVKRGNVTCGRAVVRDAAADRQFRSGIPGSIRGSHRVAAASLRAAAQASPALSRP